MDDETYTADPHVIVVGGGYAGMHAARAAKERGVRVTLVDRDGRHDFVTRLAAVAGGTAPLRDASVRSAEFVDVVERATVSGVSDGAVHLSDGRKLGADAVVLTTGAKVSTPPIDGLEHAYGLRTAEDAKLLRGLISSSDSLVIVGGGATGVQLAGAAAIAHRGLRIHLLESRDRLLSELPAELGAGAHRILRDRGVHVELGNEVERVTANGVETSSGPIEGLVVWAGGFSADAAALGVPCSESGRVLVDGSLRVEGMEHTFAAGDIAAHVDAKGEALPMSAQVAVRAGTAAGANAARVAQGREPRAVTLSQIGWVMDLGGRRGVAQMGPLSLSGPLLDQIAPAVHDLVDLKNLLEIGGVAALRFAPASVRNPFWWPGRSHSMMRGASHRRTRAGRAVPA